MGVGTKSLREQPELPDLGGLGTTGVRENPSPDPLVFDVCSDLYTCVNLEYVAQNQRKQSSLDLR